MLAKFRPTWLVASSLLVMSACGSDSDDKDGDNNIVNPCGDNAFNNEEG